MPRTCTKENKQRKSDAEFEADRRAPNTSGLSYDASQALTAMQSVGRSSGSRGTCTPARFRS
jgi:hypothetical protein